MRQKIDDGGFATPYRLRKQVVEPVFGQIKQGRGFRQVPVAGRRKSTCRVGHDLHRPQPPEAVHPRKGRLSRLPCNKCPSQCLSGRAPRDRLPLWNRSKNLELLFCTGRRDTRSVLRAALAGNDACRPHHGLCSSGSIARGRSIYSDRAVEIETTFTWTDASVLRRFPGPPLNSFRKCSPTLISSSMKEPTRIDCTSDENEYRAALLSVVQSVSITENEQSSTTRQVRRPVAKAPVSMLMRFGPTSISRVGVWP
jgi:Transposase DDE domain